MELEKTFEFEKDGSGQENLSKLIETLQKEEKEKARDKKQMRTRKTLRSKIDRNVPTSATLVASGNADNEKFNSLDQMLEEKEKKRRTVKEEDIQQLPSEEIELAPFYQPADFNLISNLGQRFSQLHMQPRNLMQLFPSRQRLLTQRSKHCRRCDRLIIKPDLSPAKIGFMRQHIAL